jgi:omega-amidase
MKCSIFQMEVIPGAPGLNREKVEKWVDSTIRDKNIDTIIFPEMWTTAYILPELNKYAETLGEPTTSFLTNIAKKYKVNIIGGSFANMVEGKIYNSSIIINKLGELLYQYDKIHLVPMLKEDLYLVGGKEPVKIFELDGIKCGVIICYDLRFPELARKLALNGVQVLFIPAEWPLVRRNHWRFLQLARAIENQFYVVSCNVVGKYDNVEFAGTSMVIDPWGEILKEGSISEEETLVVDLDLGKVGEIRKNVPIFSSRVPHLY